MLSSPRLGRIGIGINLLSAAILVVEYLLFGHVRLLALTVCLWLILFYGLHRLQPVEKRNTAPGVMEVLSGFGLVFQLLSFSTMALQLSGWAAMAPELVFLAGLMIWLIRVVCIPPANRVPASDPAAADVSVYVPSGDGWLRPRPEMPADFLADPLGAGLSEGRTARLRPTHTHAVRNAAE